MKIPVNTNPIFTPSTENISNPAMPGLPWRDAYFSKFVNAMAMETEEARRPCLMNCDGKGDHVRI